MNRLAGFLILALIFLNSCKPKIFYGIPKNDKQFHDKLKRYSEGTELGYSGLINILDTCSTEKREEFEFLIKYQTSCLDDLIGNFEENEKLLFRLMKKYKNIVPVGITLRVENNPIHEYFNTVPNISLSLYNKNDSSSMQDWNVAIESNLVDSVLGVLSWQKNELNEVLSLLDRSNCIAIRNGDPTEIFYSKNGYGVYSYVLYENLLTIEERKTVNDSCFRYFYRENIFLGYGGGAIGPQCFPEFGKNI